MVSRTECFTEKRQKWVPFQEQQSKPGQQLKQKALMFRSAASLLILQIPPKGYSNKAKLNR